MNKTTSVLKDIKSLGQLRDELKVQSHLFKVEVKKDWKKLTDKQHKSPFLVGL